MIEMFKQYIVVIISSRDILFVYSFADVCAYLNKPLELKQKYDVWKFRCPQT